VGGVTLHRMAIARFLYEPTGPVHQKVAEIVRRTEAIAKATIRVDTGRARNTGKSSVTAVPGAVIGRVEFTAHYARYLHDGTGIYGPRGRPITPKRALVFRVGGQLVFARQVRGIRGDKFLVNALKAASPWPVVES
jgi:hypothetical protein